MRDRRYRRVLGAAVLPVLAVLLAGCAGPKLTSSSNLADDDTSTDCEFQTQFGLSSKVPPEAPAYDNYSQIDGIAGRYTRQSSTTTRNFKDVEIFKSYIYAVEDTILNLANSLECVREDKSYNIDVEIILLSIADSFPGDVSKPYGHLDLNRDGQDIKGLFYLNPIQVLADQLWLHEGKTVLSEDLLFTPEEFSAWVVNYADYRYHRSEDLARQTEDIPIHLMWLFLKSPKRTFNIFAFDEWHKIVLRSEAGYTLLTQEIIKNEFCENCVTVDNPLIKLGNPKIFHSYIYNP